MFAGLTAGFLSACGSGGGPAPLEAENRLTSIVRDSIKAAGLETVQHHTVHEWRLCEDLGPTNRQKYSFDIEYTGVKRQQAHGFLRSLRDTWQTFQDRQGGKVTDDLIVNPAGLPGGVYAELDGYRVGANYYEEGTFQLGLGGTSPCVTRSEPPSK